MSKLSTTVTPEGDSRPFITLPGNGVEISATGADLGRLLSIQRSHFMFNGQVMRVDERDRGGVQMVPVRAIALASDLEAVARFSKRARNGDAHEATCSEGKASEILNSQSFQAELPVLRQVSACPVLMKRGDTTVMICGFDEESGILARGQHPPEVALDDAIELLSECVDGNHSATPSDRSRALAALIAPAMISGDWIKGRIPIDYSEADQSQTGKGFRNKLTAAIYRQVPCVVNQRRGGGGSLEASLQKAVMEGRTFISIDNVRGELDSPFLESFMTETEITARAAYTAETMVQTRGVVIMLTSNDMKMTVDLTNRISCVRMRKRPEGYKYKGYAEGTILDHVVANQPLFLGAVFAVLRAYHEAGCPRSDECRHDFREWAQRMDWIVQNILKASPLLDGHRETQKRMSNPHLAWLRGVVLAVAAADRLNDDLSASEILDILELEGGIDIPGSREGTDLTDPGVRKKALQQLGKRFSQLFGDQDRLEVDDFVVARIWSKDDQSRLCRTYEFTQLEQANKLQISPGQPADFVIEIEGSRKNPEERPLISPLRKPLVSANPADEVADWEPEDFEGWDDNFPIDDEPISGLEEISGFTAGDQREVFRTW